MIFKNNYILHIYFKINTFYTSISKCLFALTNKITVILVLLRLCIDLLSQNSLLTKFLYCMGIYSCTNAQQSIIQLLKYYIMPTVGFRTSGLQSITKTLYDSFKPSFQTLFQIRTYFWMYINCYIHPNVFFSS